MGTVDQAARRMLLQPLVSFANKQKHSFLLPMITQKRECEMMMMIEAKQASKQTCNSSNKRELENKQHAAKWTKEGEKGKENDGENCTTKNNAEAKSRTKPDTTATAVAARVDTAEKTVNNPKQK